jgi:hypothetical protein
MTANFHDTRSTMDEQKKAEAGDVALPVTTVETVRQMP